MRGLLAWLNVGHGNDPRIRYMVKFNSPSSPWPVSLASPTAPLVPPVVRFLPPVFPGKVSEPKCQALKVSCAEEEWLMYPRPHCPPCPSCAKPLNAVDQIWLMCPGPRAPGPPCPRPPCPLSANPAVSNFQARAPSGNVVDAPRVRPWPAEEMWLMRRPQWRHATFFHALAAFIQQPMSK